MFMLSWFQRRRRHRQNAHDLYGSIVSIARNQHLYSRFGVPDTVEARFELLLAHMFVFLRHLRSAGVETEPLSQSLVDAFFADMETTVRELGVGDLAVPKRMRSLAAVYEERLKAYDKAFDAKETRALAAVLSDFIAADHAAGSEGMEGLADHMRSLAARLEGVSPEALGKAARAGLEAGVASQHRHSG